MKQVFQKIWKLAKPYYQEGRSYDIDQINWMTREAERIADIENIDKNMLLPLVILHDVGYYKVKDKNPNIKDQDQKRIHMKKGVEIAKDILEKIDYNKDLTEKILYYISVHDNWIFGDNDPYHKNEILALFNDLDFLFVTSSFEHFKITGESMSLRPREFYEFWKKDEKLINRPFCCEETKKLFNKSMQKINKTIY